MNKKMQKIVIIVLAVALLVSVFLPAISALLGA